MWAASQGNVNILTFLYRAGASFKPNADGLTSLHVACASNRLEAVQFLLRRGLDWRAETKHGSTCETISAAKGFVDIYDIFKRMSSTMKYEEERLRQNNDEL